jgi:hypothetical protein
MLVQLDRRRNSTYSETGIRVKQPVRLQVVSLGEIDRGRERFVDYGWIEDRRTHKRVWDMSASRSRPAGGADKNRKTEEVIELTPGDYAVCYVTDGSHAFGDWNADPPNEPELWGIHVAYVGKEIDRSRVEQIDLAPDDNVLAAIVMVGDDARAGKEFTIAEPTTVRIIALGEGLQGRMWDYGWLRRHDSSLGKGVLVWRMHYEDTTHAGGADKNRRADVLVDLEPGEYEVHYRSDDSHSFREWNDAPPDDPHLWGITVYRTDSGR